MKTFQVFIITLLISTAGYTQSGILDNTFGTGGIVYTTLGSLSSANDIAVQPDGKPVVAGLYVNAATGFDFMLTRYNYDGTLDNSFGIGGVTTTAIGNSFGGLNSIALQPDGKIIVSGYVDGGTNDDIAVARYNSNGTLDNSFGTNGIVITAIDDLDDNSWDMLLQPDGKIVVTGSCNGLSTGYNSVIAVVRYNANGTLDNSFGTGGKVTTRVGPGHSRSLTVALQADGKLVVGGKTDIDNSTFYEDFIIVRYNANGTLDNTFDTDGMVIFGNGNLGRDEVKCVLVKPDGKIIVAGQSNIYATHSVLILAQLNTDGSFDNGFGTNGIVVNDPSPIDYSAFSDAVLQPDNKILVTGFLNTTISGSTDFIMLRFLPSGALDNSFGTNGKVITAAKLWNTATSITLKGNRIYIAGSTSNDQFNANQQWTVAAYTNCFAPILVKHDLPVALCKGSSFMSNIIVADTSIADTLRSTCLFDSVINTYHIAISNADTVVHKDSTVCYGGLYKGKPRYSTFTDVDTVLVPHSCGTRKFIQNIQVTVTPEIKNSFGKDTVLCSNGSIVLNAQRPALSYLWQDNSTNDSYIARAPGLVWVQVTDTYKCMKRDSVTIRPSDLFLSIVSDTTALPGQPVLLVPQTNGAITWSADPTLSCTLCQTTIASPLVNTTYALSAAKNGCVLNAAVHVNMAGAMYLYIPAAFTPNKDSRNDLFKVNTNITGSFLLQVFNRYGERVFTSNDTNTGWDGKYKGKEQPNGVYIYSIQYKEAASATPVQLKGQVILIR